MASPANKTGEEREYISYDAEEEESETGTPKKGRKKKEKPDLGLTMRRDIEDFLQIDGKQAQTELNKMRIDQERAKGQIRRKDPKSLLNRIESIEAEPATGPMQVVLLEDNSMFPTECSSFSLREASHMHLSFILRWRSLVCIWTAQRESSSTEVSEKATDGMSTFAEVAYHMHGRFSETRYTVGLPCKTGGPKDAHRTLNGYHCGRRRITLIPVTKISDGKIYLTHITISRLPLQMLCR